MTRPLVIAHRGYSARYTENTLTAYRAAISAGVDLVESDARLSKDGAVWSCHDATLERLTGDKRAIANLTSAELAGIALPGNERLVMLRDVLAQIAPEQKVLIDVKTVGFDLIDAIVRDVTQARAQDRVWIGMRSPDRCAGHGCLSRAFLSWPSCRTTPWQTRSKARAPTYCGVGGRPRPARGSGPSQGQAGLGDGGRSRDTDGRGRYDPRRLRRILDHRPGAILLNDPLMMAGVAAMPGLEDVKAGYDMNKGLLTTKLIREPR